MQLHRRSLLAVGAGLSILCLTAGIELASAQPASAQPASAQPASAQPASATGHDPQDGHAAIIPPEGSDPYP